MVGWFRCFSDPNSVVTEEDSTFLFSTVKPCETNGLGVRPADWRATFPEDVVYWDMVWVLCLGVRFILPPPLRSTDHPRGRWCGMHVAFKGGFFGLKRLKPRH